MSLNCFPQVEVKRDLGTELITASVMSLVYSVFSWVSALTHLLLQVLLGGQCVLVTGQSFPGLCFEKRFPSYGFSPRGTSHSDKLWLQCRLWACTLPALSPSCYLPVLRHFAHHLITLIQHWFSSWFAVNGVGVGRNSLNSWILRTERDLSGKCKKKIVRWKKEQIFFTSGLNYLPYYANQNAKSCWIWALRWSYLLLIILANHGKVAEGKILSNVTLVTAAPSWLYTESVGKETSCVPLWAKTKEHSWVNWI